MAEQIFNVNSGFYNAVDNDRLYNAEDMNRPYRRLVPNGVFATPSGTPSTDLQVVSANDGMKIIVKSGQGIFGDKWFDNPTDIMITVPENTTLLPRKDSVIVQIDNRMSGRVGSIVYRTGMYEGNPEPPEIGSVEGVMEYRIANILVEPSATVIGQEKITDLRGSNDCPWVTALIKQVDTSQLYNQWNAAYQNYYYTETERMTNYYDTGTARFEAFLETLTRQLSVTMNMIKVENSVTTTTEVSQMDINITGFNKSSDILNVYINGFKAAENSRYTISEDSTMVTFSPSIASGQRVDFVVLKSIVAADNATALQLMNEVSTKLAEVSTKLAEISAKLDI